MGGCDDRACGYGINGEAFETEVGRQHSNKKPGEKAVKKYLKNAVESDETRGVFAVTLGELVPDDDHGDTPGNADHYETHHVRWFIAQKNDGEDKHKHGADDPIHHQGQAEDFSYFGRPWPVVRI
jgi:hypothetical protein